MKKSKKYEFIRKPRNLIILTFALFFFGILFFKKNNKDGRLDIRKCSFKKKLTIHYDFSWYKKQKKYLNESSKILSISFYSIKDEKHPDVKYLRKGYLLINKNAKATVVVCHGFMTSKEDMALSRYIFSDYNVLVFDFRAHGEETNNQCCTFGFDEKNDVIAAVDFIRSRPDIGNKPIFAYAFSMGAVATIMALNQKENLFAGAILDCPFESTEELVERAVRKMNLDLFGFSITIPGGFLLKKYVYNEYMQECLKILLRTFAKMDATQINTLIRPISPKQAISNIKIPLMLIGCHNDDKAPPEALKSIYDNAKSASFKRLWISTGRHHYDSFAINPEKYIYKITLFIENILNNKIKDKSKEKIKEDPCIYQFK